PQTQGRHRSVVVYFCCSHGPSGNYHFYVPRSTYMGLPEVLKDIRLLLEQVLVEATNFATTARPERTAQGGHAGKGQHRLVGATREVHPGVES
ncbi:hypothetical protein Gotur_007645, partial [Gossypium turneri]